MATPNYLRTAHKSARLGATSALRSSCTTPSAPTLLAALLYEDWSTSYSRSFKHFDVNYNLTVECRPTAPSVQAHQTLYFCPPQSRYTMPKQCEYILHSKAIEGKKEFLTGLRSVPMPMTLPLGVQLFVGDYKADRHSKGAALTTVVLQGKQEGCRPGWVLVVVVDKSYRRRGAGVNAETAKAITLVVLPQLQEWLSKLPLEELQAA
jgi:hypothetical protein